MSPKVHDQESVDDSKTHSMDTKRLKRRILKDFFEKHCVVDAHLTRGRSGKALPPPKEVFKEATWKAEHVTPGVWWLQWICV